MTLFPRFCERQSFGKLYVTYDIARQFPGYGPEAGASSSAFAERIIYHMRKG